MLTSKELELANSILMAVKYSGTVVYNRSELSEYKGYNIIHAIREVESKGIKCEKISDRNGKLIAFIVRE